MRWEDLDLASADWRYVVGKTQHLSRTKHIVPLSKQALKILRELRERAVVDEQGRGCGIPLPCSPQQPH